MSYEFHLCLLDTLKVSVLILCQISI